MKTKKSKSYHFLVLVPHRDIRQELRRYSDTLFKAGFWGGHHFPWVAPLARLSKPLKDTELKEIGYNISHRFAKISHGFSQIPTDFHGFINKDLAIFGSPLISFNKILEEFFMRPERKVSKYKIYSPAILGNCLLLKGEQFPDIPPPNLSFKAAAIANMRFRIIETQDSIESRWKIGKLFWLKKC